MDSLTDVTTYRPRLAAMLEACDRALRRLARVDGEEVEVLRRDLELFRDAVQRRLDADAPSLAERRAV